jgi:hypothetical protein
MYFLPFFCVPFFPRAAAIQDATIQDFLDCLRGKFYGEG